ncbi:MAG: EF-Tu/IF-2/RF-3 family GTPase [Anaerolineae bacterium]
MAEDLIGKVSHWFGKISVAGIELTGKLAVGDHIRIRGYTTDFEQDVTSMQLMHQDMSEASPGDDVGIKVQLRARPGDCVYKVT